MFVNRAAELDLLEKRFASGKAEFFVLYGRRGIYRLKGHYLRFWFHYVHPNRSQLERGGSQMILKSPGECAGDRDF